MTATDEPSRAISDADAIANSLEDPGCFAVLFDRHCDAISGCLSRRAGQALADELAGETFVRAFAGRARYDLTQLDARPWLCMGSRRTCCESTRGRRCADGGHTLARPSPTVRAVALTARTGALTRRCAGRLSRRLLLAFSPWI